MNKVKILKWNYCIQNCSLDRIKEFSGRDRMNVLPSQRSQGNRHIYLHMPA